MFCTDYELSVIEAPYAVIASFENHIVVHCCQVRSVCKEESLTKLPG